MWKSLLNLINMIPKSITDKFNRISSVRIQAILLFGVIELFALVFLGIEIAAAVIAFLNVGKYVLSNEILVVFGALMTHHLGLLFNKRKEYSPDEKIQNALPPLPDTITKESEEIIKKAETITKKTEDLG